MSKYEYQSYLQGALHDGTRSDLHNTYRISQKGTNWLSRLSDMLAEIGHKSWMYQEGKTREVYVLETTAKFLDVNFNPDLLESDAERIAYVRGYEVDPNYWRFYVRANSHKAFAETIGSWHPRKAGIFQRMKI